MKKHKRSYLILGFIAFIAAVSLLLVSSGIFQPAESAWSEASKGRLDLTGMDFEKERPAKLAGEWEFYWNQLLGPEDFEKDSPRMTGYIDVPKSWNGYIVNGETLKGGGCATYRLKVSVNQSAGIYGLKVLPMGTSYRLWVNGTLLSSNGKVGKSRAEAAAQYLAKEVFFNSREPELELIVQISNFQHQKGGFWYSLTLGSAQQIEKSLFSKFWFNMFLTGALFMFSLYHFGLFLLRRKERSTLFFALFCLDVSIRNLTFNEYYITRFFNDLNWAAVVKIEYLSLYLILPLALIFFHLLFPDELSKRVVRTASAVSAVFCLFVLFAPPRLFSYTLDPYLCLILLGMFYILYGLLKALFQKREGASIVLFGYAFLMLTGINDIIAKYTAVNIGIFFHLGLFVFTFSQSFILSQRFSKAFSSVETLSESLMTYSKELEDKNLRLEEVDKLKDDFLANTTHELKTPLHGMIGIAEAALEDTEGASAAETERLKLIISSARRLSGLVNDILDFSKMKHQDLNLNIKPVDLWPVTEVVLTLLKPLADAKHLKYENEISEEAPLIAADEDRLRQILQNLIGNAIKFTDTGQITVSAVPKEGKLEISVSDTGIGIPADKLEAIFQPFEQALPDGGAAYGGTGLGLNITKRLVELHGGEIGVFSKVGEGSKFIFTIPLSDIERDRSITPPVKTELPQDVPPEEKEAIPASDENSGKTAVTILIADDEPVNLQILTDLFAREEYHTVTAADGQEALEKALGALKPDLAILDIMMPKMSGFEVSRKIRERYTLYELPILVITARNRTGDILAGFEAGANDFLSKPFDRKELRARVRTLLELKKTMEQAVTAELHFLQAQIRPHFIYNALNSVMALCRKDPERARAMIMELSNYLRGSFDISTDEKLVTLDKELSLIKSYLAIEKERFGERLKVLYDIDESIDLLLPPLILQPIVENAVRHGLLSKTEGGTVKVSAKDMQSYILMRVEDDGVGMDPEKLDRILAGRERPAGTGVGLANIYKRMNTLYGYGPDITTVKGKGTDVKLKIPKGRSKGYAEDRNRG